MPLSFHSHLPAPLQLFLLISSFFPFLLITRVVFLFVFYDALTLVDVAYYYGLYTFLFVILQFFVFLLVTRFCFLKACSLGTVIYAIFYYFSFNAFR